MKRFLITFAMIAAIAFQASAMSYEQARERALFLTDKMAYELNLNDQQYEAAYEVNLDYLMSINTYDDLYGTYWTRRNLDLSYILFDWQYSAFCSAAYFYRPLVWADGVWRFSIYSRYPHRSYFYFGRPDFYLSYRGGHSWHMNGDRSWYHGRTFGHRPGNDNFGMRDRFDRGDFRGTRNHGQSGNINTGRNNNRGNGNFNRGNGNYNGNNGGFNRNDNGQMNRTDNNGRRNNGTFNGNRNNSGAGNGFTGGRNWNRGNSSNNGGFTTIRPNGSAAQRSSTRTTAERMSTTDNTATATHHEQTMGEGFSRGSSTRPSQTFTPSRSSSSRSSMSTSRSNMSSGSMSHSSSPSRGMSTSRSSVSSSMPSHSSGASHGGGFSSGGGRSGGGGHFGGRR